ncbi:MAG: hypothetical protein JWN03_3221 [Nocardia sp.]|uniref:hypothetical protein n=1 Tax=Nocardia sp. TaxID=1821 RepID=UPI0026184DFC|nr:hypothetical protein [Nocardia sp.]MCU1642946.1 hypothetical protein [Nocardia sp.]
MDESLSGANLQNLLAQVLARYGSIDAFCAQLYRWLDYPTTELPILIGLPDTSRGRHQFRDVC